MSGEFEILLSLVRSALWQIPATNIPPGTDWDAVFVQGERQTLLGLLADAVQLLPKEEWPPQKIRTKLMTARVNSMKAHALLNARLAQILTFMRDEGIEPILFKGQGLANNYPDPTSRQCGDIDLYVGGANYTKACNVAIKHFGRDSSDTESAKHYHLKYKEVDVELHKIAEMLPGYITNRRFQEWTKMHLCGERIRKIDISGAEVSLPPVQFDCIYVLNHLWHHFITGGVGLRQLCDWVLLLHRFHSNIDICQLQSDLKSFHLLEVWYIFADIAVNIFGLPQQECPLYRGEYEKKRLFILNTIFEDGNFGHYREGKNNRPPDFIAGKLHSLRLNSKRFWRLMKVFPSQGAKYYIHYLRVGIFQVVKTIF